jgi:hypothetical protein
MFFPVKPNYGIGRNEFPILMILPIAEGIAAPEKDCENDPIA